MELEQKRRIPRIPVSCPVAIRLKNAGWITETADLGQRGCRVLLQRAVSAGSLVELRFQRENLPPLDVVGQVCWAKPKAPFEAGIKFMAVPRNPEGVPQPRWLDSLVSAHLRRILASWESSKGPLEQVSKVAIELGIPPTEVLNQAEAGMVRLAREGTTFAWVCRTPESVNVLASLLDRGILSVTRQTPDPEGWKRALSLISEAAPHASQQQRRP